MAGVEQATAPGEATPGDTPKTEPRTGRRRASQQAGRQSDTPKPTGAHARTDADDGTRPGSPADDPKQPGSHAEEPAAKRAGAHADEPAADPTAKHAHEPTAEPAAKRADAYADKPAADPTAKHASEPTAKHADEPIDAPADQPAAKHVGARADKPASEPAAKRAGAHADKPTSEAAAKHAGAHADESAERGPEAPADNAHRQSDKADPATDSGSGRTVRAAGPAHAGAPTYRPRHAKHRRRRWPLLVAAGVVLVALAGIGAAALINHQNDELDDLTAPAATRIAPAPANLPAGDASGVPSAGGSAAPPAAAAPGAAPGATPGTAAGAAVACRYNVAADKTPRVVPPDKATRSGLVNVTIGTNRGPITLELDAANAPCTVESFLTLAAGGYFNDTACHRLTTMLIFVLQCGDPTATGSGDPGYSFDDENLPAPGGTPYPRGTLAMANAGPDTNGSQFFVVYKDSPIDPNYPVFGKVTGGLELVDQVASGGAPGNDGQPNQSLVIQAVQIS